MNIPFIDLKSQYESMKAQMDAAVIGVLESTQFIGGPQLNKLEESLAAYTGAKHAIGCSSGTDALLLAMMALEIGPGDEVITSPFTFIATAETIAFLGAVPVFVDIDEATYNLDVSQVEGKITSKTKAIVPVSLYGQPADMDELNALAAKHGLAVIEDAAQSFGAEYKGKKSGNLSTIGCTSFFPSKPLGCYGDGGAVFTNDDALAAKVRSLLNHGQTERYVHKYIGINGRLDAVQAAVLNVKMETFPAEVEKRIAIGARYSEALKDAVTVPEVKSDRTSVYAQYSIRVKDREKTVAGLQAAGVPTAVHYPIPLYKQEAFASLGCDASDFPVSEAVAAQIMSLPMSPFLTEEQQDAVIAAVRSNA